MLSCLFASQNWFRCLRSSPCVFNGCRLRVCYFVLQRLVLRRELVWLWLRNIKGLTLEIKGVRTFTQNFVNFVLLSFLLPIKFFFEVVSTTLGPIQKFIFSLLSLIIFFLLRSPEIVIRVVNSLWQIQRYLLLQFFTLTWSSRWRFLRWLRFVASWATKFAATSQGRFGLLHGDSSLGLRLSHKNGVT